MTEKEKTSKAIESNQKVNSGIFVSGGIIEQSDYDNQIDYKTLMQDYTDMRNSDPIVSTSLDILLYPIINSKMKVEPQSIDEQKEPSDLALEASEYVQYCFDNLYPNYSDYIRHLVLAFYYGFAVFEKVYIRAESFNGKLTNRLIRLSPIQHDAIYKFYYDEKAYFSGLDIYNRIPEKAFNIVHIDRKDLFVFTPFSEFNNVVGRSMIRASRLCWKLKQQVMKASARATIRGAGIPNIIINPVDEKEGIELKTKAESIGRNLGNSENAFVVSQKDRLEVELMNIQGTENSTMLIELYNKEIVYNTMTQFIVSGIGGNGSRAATSEHKSPYLEALSALISLIESANKDIVEDMIDNSYFYGRLDKAEYPAFTLERPKEANLRDVAANIIGLQTSGVIRFTPEDQVYIRSIFGLPEKTVEEIQKADDEAMIKAMEISGTKQESIQKTQDEKPVIDSTEKKLSAIQNRNIDIDEAMELFRVTREKTMKIIDAIIPDMLDNIVYQVSVEKKNPESIETPYTSKIMKKLTDIFGKLFENGRKSVNKQYKLANSTLDALTLSKSKNKLQYSVKVLGEVVKNTIAKDLIIMTPEAIDNAGGLKEYINTTYKDAFVKPKTDISGIVEQAYTAGRNYELAILEDLLRIGQPKRRYLTQLETGGDRTKICEICYPLNNLTFTQEEATLAGLKWDETPINPNCLGGDQCKCQWEMVVE